jgi:broad specificity phosphatase PhoE
MPKIYLLRHGQSEANEQGILAGPDNSIKLTQRGIKQSKLAAKHLHKINFQKIYCSPISRCFETVEPLTKIRSDIEFEYHEDLREMDYGKWNGQKLETLSKKRDWKVIQTAPASFKFPEGESFAQMRNRVQNFLTEVSGQAGPILVISHGDVIKMFLNCTLNQPINTFQRFAITPASLSIIEYSKTSKSIISTNQRFSQTSISDRLTKFLPGGENA